MRPMLLSSFDVIRGHRKGTLVWVKWVKICTFEFKILWITIEVFCETRQTIFFCFNAILPVVLSLFFYYALRTKRFLQNILAICYNILLIIKSKLIILPWFAKKKPTPLLRSKKRRKRGDHQVTAWPLKSKDVFSFAVLIFRILLGFLVTQKVLEFPFLYFFFSFPLMFWKYKQKTFSYVWWKMFWWKIFS